MLDEKEIVAKSVVTLDPSICAIMIRKGGAPGCVRVFGNSIKNIIAGPEKKGGRIVVLVKHGEECMIMGEPNVRFFRRRNLEGEAAAAARAPARAIEAAAAAERARTRVPGGMWIPLRRPKIAGGTHEASDGASKSAES